MEDRVIPLSKGKFAAIISGEDYRRVNRHSWHVSYGRGRGRAKGLPYARATINGKKVLLHRFIMQTPDDLHCDHKNHCTLDCRRSNLENVTHAENYKRKRK